MPDVPHPRRATPIPPASRRGELRPAKRTIKPRPFALGQLLATPGALENLHLDDTKAAFMRHMNCDWGDCGEDDWAENDYALDSHLRLLSVYHDRNGTKFWIITEADRSATTALLPSEY